MAPCDYAGEGGFFILDTAGQLFHIGKSTWNQPDECLEPNLIPGHREFISVGECSSAWRISSTPQCSKSEVVIA